MARSSMVMTAVSSVDLVENNSNTNLEGNSMGKVIAKALVTMLTKVVTQKFVEAIFILILEHLAKMSSNKLDDKAVEEIKKALGK